MKLVTFGINSRGEHEKTALSDGSIGFVPFGDNWYLCLTQGVNLTFGQGTRSTFRLSSRPRRNWSISGLDIRGENEKTALSDGSIGFVPFGKK